MNNWHFGRNNIKRTVLTMALQGIQTTLYLIFNGIESRGAGVSQSPWTEELLHPTSLGHDVINQPSIALPTHAIYYSHFISVAPFYPSKVGTPKPPLFDIVFSYYYQSSQIFIFSCWSSERKFQHKKNCGLDKVCKKIIQVQIFLGRCSKIISSTYIYINFGDVHRVMVVVSSMVQFGVHPP